ncbi:MAG: CDP-alcohol phosphatidyltransferase family protein [Dehalococcoidales bacterium]|nr:CDP-alcohol phosphatidyltransferase family protein [Dehalococcoidales bacterium]NLT28327.1 CDP-alcohol phosphatidyltransferase family protein [Dehalococcoidales bacterium]
MTITAEPQIKIKLNVPNIITTSRIIMTGIIVALLALGSETQILAAGIILIIAALTDFLDGNLARRMKQESRFGSLYDMIADQILFMPTLVLAIVAGCFARTDGLVFWNPYLYAVPALLGGVVAMTGIVIYLIKRRKKDFEFPTPTKIAKLNYWFWLVPLILAILNIGPDILLAILMYMALVSTILTFYSYLKKGSYVFTD